MLETLIDPQSLLILMALESVALFLLLFRMGGDIHRILLCLRLLLVLKRNGKEK